ncbi:hypothetical protein COCCADRAFT_97465 [Bipolaris zeicola 26-R-13]|uniref:Uncharacterized protein n=1 Tax=Cochliobolus carbonum (strain 26-R-13) TaxID=930089 RepID=W6YBN6_COCC2|nr:uncharacterized protein COCCADRAFT_97465 [Bipolaris zeicola 26-R-13]EUC32914.1 hypothetical protein COCCADRAFT_97465 [Bipolaris zeicola 26-R-13]
MEFTQRAQFPPSRCLVGLSRQGWQSEVSISRHNQRRLSRRREMTSVSTRRAQSGAGSAREASIRPEVCVGDVSAIASGLTEGVKDAVLSGS